MITLETLFPAEHVLMLRPRDKEAALAELAKRASVLLGTNPTLIGSALAARETLGSTGIGAGIALPHARLSLQPLPLALFARLERPISWESIDQKPVDLIFLLLSPSEPADFHLKVLAMVTRRLRDVTIAAALRQTTDREALRACLSG